MYKWISFRSLQTYMVLKLVQGHLHMPQFQILTNLHGSQTYSLSLSAFLGFRSLQTYMVLKHTQKVMAIQEVLDPYKLTWFSNPTDATDAADYVLDPYKLTWFSNAKSILIIKTYVLDPYKLTWFSNVYQMGSCLTLFQILTNLHGSQTVVALVYSLAGFRSLQTYMVLKHLLRYRQLKIVLDPYKLTWFSNSRYTERCQITFQILTNLHGSQTSSGTYILSAVVLDPYKLTWFSNVKFKNFAVLTELLHTDICCKPIFLIPHVYFTT